MIELDALQVIACATCSLDRASQGQILVLATMLAMPLGALVVGFLVVRRLLRTLRHRLET